MVFSSAVFLFFFLPAVLGAYYVAPRRFRNLVLLLFSLGFYLWGAGWITLVLLGSIAVNYVIGLRVERAVDEGRASRAKRVLAVGVIVNVSLLAWFKYANFGVETASGMVQAVGLPAMPWAEILLPIGISFYTFHALSYLVDIYRGTARHLVAPVDFALYIAFFPQLIAGPIVRFHEIRDQLVQRTETADAFAAGIYRFSLGLAKKVVIADTVAPLADAVFAVPADQLNMPTAALGLVAYSVQLYFDFSGYSDMALGLGMMFGIRLPENFARPYASRSVTEFWRRWHMSLSRWFRDYLYIPLGGNRGTRAQTYRNLVIVFLVTGLWHGASWTFIVWGGYHGVLLLIERMAGVGRGGSLERSWAWQPVTVALVLFGWILFRSPTLEYAAGFVAALTRLETTLLPAVALVINPLVIVALVVGAGSVLLPASWVTGVRLEDPAPLFNRVLRLGFAWVLLPLSVLLVVASGFSPFLYFQF
jgi:alginate O-acetyltransferase complex protein AlgI